MSITTKPKTAIASSAAAISAIGLMTGPAIAHAAPDCTFNGTYILNQSNGYRVEVPWNGKSPAGNAVAYGNNQTLAGPVTGGGVTSAGNEISFVIDWNGPPIGQYVGTLDAGGNVRGGFNQDLRAGAKASWDSVTPFTCVAAPAQTPIPTPTPTPTPTATQAPRPPPMATVTDDVDLYDAPGGDGNVIGVLRASQKVDFVGCRADNWCEVKGGWVWGDFLQKP